MNLKELEVWFITGSQHLYGRETLAKVAEHSKEIADSLSCSGEIPAKIVSKPVAAESAAVKNICIKAEADENCIGLIMWMHTFSPSRMWISGLSRLKKPFLHLHTQYNRDIPWSKIDMDFMNLNQSAHGGREFGYICTRTGLSRTVVVGHWQDAEVLRETGTWIRAAAAWHDAQGAKIARFGDNMRNVAVTEGDKIEAQIRLGYEVNGYGTGDLTAHINKVPDSVIDELICEYLEHYNVSKALLPSGQKHSSLREAARIEAGMDAFLKEGGFKGFTTTFENLHGLKQLPGLAAQRLMAGGFGFGAEGDWKTAALVRAMKVMASGLEGGTSFMEDYTYHLDPDRMMVLGAHMLEVCPSISAEKPSLEIHPLSIGGKSDPARLVFNAAPGRAVNASVIDLGDRFRMIVNEIEVIEPEFEIPNLPVARALWIPKPDLRTAAHAWILAGGAHHTSFSGAVTVEMLENFAEIAGLELIVIDEDTEIREFKKDLKRGGF